jgi:Reverse transcriptase (RNA-dependent DNA polymerase)
VTVSFWTFWSPNHPSYTTNNILSPCQFGFRKSHSTVHPLTLFTNSVAQSLNNKEHSIAIFCDLKKAFDTVDHSILLKKLSKIGVNNQSLKWFESYLSDRY